MANPYPNSNASVEEIWKKAFDQYHESCDEDEKASLVTYQHLSISELRNRLSSTVERIDRDRKSDKKLQKIILPFIDAVHPLCSVIGDGLSVVSIN